MCVSPIYRFPYVVDGQVVWSSSPPRGFNPDRVYTVPVPGGEPGEVLTAVQVPCGHCSECIFRHREEWVLRLSQEAAKYRDNMFLTLTYDPEHLPADQSVNRRDIQLFIKRLRNLAEPVRIKMFYCGEYGSQGARPHYHAAIFGYSFSDSVPFRKDKKGVQLFRSRALESLWDLGFSSLAPVCPETLRYVTKDMQKLLPLNGDRTSPFVGMSHGLGDPDSADFVTDKVYFNGKAYLIPRYYVKKADHADQVAHRLNVRAPSIISEDLDLRFEKNENFKKIFKSS